jgi:prepilin-type N-terminal cleavage/methylation domain-containing protein
MTIKTSRKSGFTLIELMIVVTVISLLAGISTPRFVKARDTSQLNAIVNNLRIIEESKDTWALENKKGDGALPTTTDLSGFSGNAMPTPVAVKATISIRLALQPATLIRPLVPFPRR